MASASTSSFARVPVAAKIGIGAGLVALVTIAYFTIFHNDVASSIRNAQSQEGVLRKKLENAKAIEYAYQQDLAELTKRQQRQRDLNKVLPEDAAYPAFLSAIQGVANSSGVLLTAWSPIDESIQEHYAKVPMRLKLTGRFHQIAKFFYGVSQLDRIINIGDIELGKPKVVDDDITVEAECLATAFRSLSPKDAPVANAPTKSGTGKNRK